MLSVEDWADIRRLHRAERMFGELMRRCPASGRPLVYNRSGTIR